MPDLHDIHSKASLAAQRKTPQAEGQLTVDVFQDAQNVYVQSTIAGISAEEIDISITSDMVTIKGDRQPDHQTRPGDYFHQELYWGPFSRSIILPMDVDADRAKANMKNGVLTIRLPKLNK